jgi:trigger factor
MPCRQKHKHKARHHTHAVKPANLSRVNPFPVGGAPKAETAPEPAAVAAAPVTTAKPAAKPEKKTEKSAETKPAAKKAAPKKAAATA